MVNVNEFINTTRKHQYLYKKYSLYTFDCIILTDIFNVPNKFALFPIIFNITIKKHM